MGLTRIRSVVSGLVVGLLRIQRLATLVVAPAAGDAGPPVDFVVTDGAGRTVHHGRSQPSAHLTIGDTRYRDAVTGGVDYLFGRDALGQSYVTGYGTDASRYQRTRRWGHDLDPTLPPPPPGALAGGANSVVTPGFPSDPRLAGLPPRVGGDYLSVSG